MAALDDAFRTNAISLDDAVGIFFSTADPSTGAGFIAPVGSLLLRDSGEAWVKIGTSDTSWSLLQSGGTPLNTITIRDEGALVGNFSTINFTGTGVTVTDSGGIAQVSIPTPVSVFGSEYQYIEDATISTSTAQTYQTKVTLTTSSLIGGTYRIGWSTKYNYDASNTNFLARVIIDGTVVTDEVEIEPTDASGDYAGTGSSQRYIMAGFKQYTFTPGVHTIAIQYRSSSANTAASVWDSRIEFWRVF